MIPIRFALDRHVAPAVMAGASRSALLAFVLAARHHVHDLQRPAGASCGATSSRWRPGRCGRRPRRRQRARATAEHARDGARSDRARAATCLAALLGGVWWPRLAALLSLGRIDPSLCGPSSAIFIAGSLPRVTEYCVAAATWASPWRFSAAPATRAIRAHQSSRGVSVGYQRVPRRLRALALIRDRAAQRAIIIPNIVAAVVSVATILVLAALPLGRREAVPRVTPTTLRAVQGTEARPDLGSTPGRTGDLGASRARALGCRRLLDRRRVARRAGDGGGRHALHRASALQRHRPLQRASDRRDLRRPWR